MIFGEPKKGTEQKYSKTSQQDRSSEEINPYSYALVLTKIVQQNPDTQGLSRPLSGVQDDTGWGVVKEESGIRVVKAPVGWMSAKDHKSFLSENRVLRLELNDLPKREVA